MNNTSSDSQSITLDDELKKEGYTDSAISSIKRGLVECDYKLCYSGLPWERKPIIHFIEWCRNNIRIVFFTIFSRDFRNRYWEENYPRV